MTYTAGLPSVTALVDEALQKQRAQHIKRDYLGASQLGEPCGRKIQYAFWDVARDEALTGDQLRTFAIGHHLEKLMAQWVRDAGLDLRTHKADGEPFGFKVAQGQIAGHVDGVLIGGPEGYAYPALWECKTANGKNWRQCQLHGVAQSKPIYYTQIQLYMAYMQLTDNPALFTALNKDTSEIYVEWVPFDPAVAQQYSDRAVQILKANTVQEWLPRIKDNPDFYLCKMCPWHKTCYGGQR